MATSPLVKDMSYLSIVVMVDGKQIKDEYSLLSVEVSTAINTIPHATFILLLPLGESENKTFALSEGSEFIPGAEVEIKAGYSSKTDSIFKGIIIRHGIKAKAGQRSQLTLYCQDEAVKMTIGKKVKAFTKQTDSAIIGSLIDASSLEKDVDSTSYSYVQLLQSGTTDWDFMITRAEVNGLIAYADAGKVFVKAPQSSGAPALELSYDRDVFSFEAALDAGYQFPSVTASGWDFASGEFVEATASEPSVNKHGDPTGKKMAAVLGATDAAIQFTGPMETEELKGIAQGTLLRSRLAAIRGRVSFYGNAMPKLNTLIKLTGFGDRFNGEALITSINHKIYEGNWHTETGFGLSPDLHFEKHRLGNGNSGMLPSINGLQNGIVKQIHKDPDGEHRIQVTFPILGTDIWSRLGGYYAGKGYGNFFMPEVGDEVIAGFLNDDPRYAIILGSVYSSKNAPPYTADDKNSIKALTTKSKLKIELNDEKKILTLGTPAGNSIVLSDEDKAITITDQHGNKIAMESAGITIKSAKDITIEAAGKMTLKAAQNIDVSSSSGDVALKGMNVNGNGSVGVKMKGGASAELSAGGQTTVKGAMVMIN